MPALSLRARERWFVAITLAAFLYAVGTPAVQSFTASKYQTGVGQQAVPLSALALKVSKASPLLICALCLAVILLHVRELPRKGAGALLVLLLPWVYLVVRDEYLGTSPHVYSFCYPLICGAIWCLRPPLEALRWLGYLVGGTAVLALAMGWLLPAKGIYQSAGGTEISLDKNIFSSGILVGPLSSGNNLGQFLVMGTAAILLIPHRGWRWVLFAASVYAQLWAASRSCLAALAVLLLVAVVWKVVRPALRGLLVGLILLAMTVLLIALPFVTTDQASFSNRGYVWHVSKQAWHSDVIFGLGSTFYSRIALTSAAFGNSVFHGHNQLVQDLVTGGWVLALLMGAVIVVAIAVAARSAHRGEAFPGLFMIGLIGASLLEVSYVLVDRFFALPVMVVPLACIMFATKKPAGPDIVVQRSVDRQAGSPSAVGPQPPPVRDGDGLDARSEVSDHHRAVRDNSAQELRQADRLPIRVQKSVPAASRHVRVAGRRGSLGHRRP